LALQGGGALGANQAEVYQALAEAKIYPNWIAGISIGAINGALIAGNAPKSTRRQAARVLGRHYRRPVVEFRRVDEHPEGRCCAAMAEPIARGLHPSGTAEATSFYDTSHLRATLERLVDFDRLNAGGIRFSIGAGEHYWDGGLVSNTPLQWVVDRESRLDTLAFQVDLWSARGELPRTLTEVSTRMKEIQYSSRTRAGTDSFKYMQRLRRAAADLLEKLPDHLRHGPEATLLQNVAHRKAYNIVQLIYRAKNYEGPAKDYEFSRASMEEHWCTVYYDAVRALRHPELLERPTNHEGVFTFGLAVDGRE
jgi:NTE family protein